MNYIALSSEQQEEIAVQFLEATERDHFCHQLNRDRYVEMLKDLQPNDPFKKRIQQLLTETESRITEVELIIAKTLPQVQNVDVQAVQARLKAAADKNSLATALTEAMKAK